HRRPDSRYYRWRLSVPGAWAARVRASPREPREAHDLNRFQLLWRAAKWRRRPQRGSRRTPLQIDCSASNPFDQIPPGAPGMAADKWEGDPWPGGARVA